MYITKAFDSLNQHELLSTVSELGIQKNTLNWFKTYLYNRKQYVELNHYNNKMKISLQSKIRTVKYGVPQGSILGPLLFICHITNMPKFM